MLLADLVPPVAVKLIGRALRRPEINPTPDGVGQFAPGHFYSPIPSPDDVTARLEFSRAKTPQFPDIQLSMNSCSSDCWSGLRAAYFLRAFLAFNHEWPIYFFNNYVVTHFQGFLSQHMLLCLKDIGGSLYLQRHA